MAAAAAGSADVGATAATVAPMAEASTLATAGAYAGAGASALASTGGLLALGSGAMSGLGAAMQANAQQQSDKYQAQIEGNNASLAVEQRSAAIQQGQAQAMQQEYQAAQVLGDQKANLAANGVVLNSGSAIDLLATTKFLNAQDVNTIQSNAARQAWGYGVDAANSQAAGGLAAWQASNTSPAGIGVIGGAASLLGSASLYAMGNKTNLFSSLTG